MVVYCIFVRRCWVSLHDLNLPISCKNHWAQCDFSGDLESVITHEENCPYREVTCILSNCYEPIRFNEIEDHMAKEHAKMLNGQWHIFPKVPKNIEYNTYQNF